MPFPIQRSIPCSGREERGIDSTQFVNSFTKQLPHFARPQVNPGPQGGREVAAVAPLKIGPLPV
jgi:hypothetical protein